VERNRAKRLLREAFRLSGAELDGLALKYDWVLNARRAILTVKMAAPLEEFQRIIARASNDERAAAVSSRAVSKQ
jgi:ribonuclease P protein component